MTGHIFTFSELTDHAVVVLAVEEVPGYILADYVQAFRKAANDMHFADDGRFTETDGVPRWQASGNIVDAGTNRLNVQIWQVGSAFWRTITIQMMPYAYSDPFVKDLTAALWTTITLRRNADVAMHRVTNAGSVQGTRHATALSFGNSVLTRELSILQKTALMLMPSDSLRARETDAAMALRIRCFGYFSAARSAPKLM
jgi:hypothetical protein